MVENPIVEPKFRHFSTYVTVSLSKFNHIAIALILKLPYECTGFSIFSTFSSVL
jgi:hypothetical protein